MTYTQGWDAAQVGFGPGIRNLIEEELVPDRAVVVRTGTYVVDPPFFGNGDIGRVAVCGAVNELAVTGAEPRHVALGIVLEAGLPLELVRRLTASVRTAAAEAGVAIAAVDTQVVRAERQTGSSSPRPPSGCWAADRPWTCTRCGPATASW